MFEKFVNGILRKQLKKSAMLEDDIEVLKYGYYILCEWGLNIFIAFSIAILMKSGTFIFAYLLTIIPLRSYAGGWHAKEDWQCVIVSNLGMLLFAFITKQCINTPYSYVSILLLEAIFSLLIYQLAPIENENKPLSELEKLKYQKISRIVYGIELVVLIGCIITKFEVIQYAIFSAHLFTVICLVSAKIIGKHSKKAKQS